MIKLKARRYPGGWMVCDEALEEFLDELTTAALKKSEESGPDEAPATVPLTKRRQRELAQVDREMGDAGFGTPPPAKRPGRRPVAPPAAEPTQDPPGRRGRRRKAGEEREP
jgi:hypothetical protein